MHRGAKRQLLHIPLLREQVRYGRLALIQKDGNLSLTELGQRRHRDISSLSYGVSRMLNRAMQDKNWQNGG